MQRPVGGHVGWVDLELDVRGPDRTLIWVEVKLGHRLSRANQLDKYLRQLERFDAGSADRFVVLLAPGDRRAALGSVDLLSESSGAASPGPFFVAWQDLYAILAEGGLGRHNGHVRWMLREVLGYMEGEGLKPSLLKRRHVDALRYIDDALAALESVLETARLRLSSDGWTAVSKPPAIDGSYWEYEYRPWPCGGRTSRRTRARLAWGIDPDLFAGIYFERDAGGPIRPVADERWHLALELSGSTASGVPEWDEDDGDRNAVWIGSSRKLDQVANGASATQQGDQIAAFVADVFSRMVETRPERPTNAS